MCHASCRVRRETVSRPIRRVPSASVLLLLLLLPCCAFAIRRGAVEPESVTSCWARPSRPYVSSPSPPPARGCHGALMRRPAMQAVRGRHGRSRPPRLLAVLPRGPWEQDARPQGPCNHGVHPGTGVHFATTSKCRPHMRPYHVIIPVPYPTFPCPSDCVLSHRHGQTGQMHRPLLAQRRSRR